MNNVYRLVAVQESKVRGMQLGKKNEKSLYDAIKHDENIPDSPKVVELNAERTKTPQNISSAPVQITIEEKITLTCEKDGGIQNMEIKGDLVFKVNNVENGLCRINTSIQSDLGVQFKVRFLSLL